MAEFQSLRGMEGIGTPCQHPVLRIAVGSIPERDGGDWDLERVEGSIVHAGFNP